MVHVPFKGTAPALQALMANDIQILVDVPSTLMPHVRGGKIKALAMFSKDRIQGAQEVPTMAQAGGPALESSTWVLFMAPGGTPKPIIDRLAAETAKGDQRVRHQGALQPDRHRAGRQLARPGSQVPGRRDRQVGQGHQHRRGQSRTMKNGLVSSSFCARVPPSRSPGLLNRSATSSRSRPAPSTTRWRARSPPTCRRPWANR